VTFLPLSRLAVDIKCGAEAHSAEAKSGGRCG